MGTGGTSIQRGHGRSSEQVTRDGGADVWRSQSQALHSSHTPPCCYPLLTRLSPGRQGPAVWMVTALATNQPLDQPKLFFSHKKSDSCCTPRLGTVLGGKDSTPPTPAPGFFCHMNSPTAMGLEPSSGARAPLNSPQAWLSTTLLVCAPPERKGGSTVWLLIGPGRWDAQSGWGQAQGLSSCHLAAGEVRMANLGPSVSWVLGVNWVHSI